MLRIAVVAALLTALPEGWVDAADIGMHRTPVSGSISCSGSLDEVYGETGNQYGTKRELVLTCSKQGNVEWVLTASVGCTISKTSRAEPVSRFFADQGTTHIYQLIKYVFAEHCSTIDVRIRRVAPQAGTMRTDARTPETICTDVKIVDGSVGDQGFFDIDPAKYRYTTITTRGGEEKGDDSPEMPFLSNVDPEASSYHAGR